MPCFSLEKTVFPKSASRARGDNRSIVLLLNLVDRGIALPLLDKRHVLKGVTRISSHSRHNRRRATHRNARGRLNLGFSKSASITYLRLHIGRRRIIPRRRGLFLRPPVEQAIPGPLH